MVRHLIEQKIECRCNNTYYLVKS